MHAYCPSCHAENPRPAPGAQMACRVCGCALVLAGRFVLEEPRPAEQGADVADGAAPMWRGRDLDDDRLVTVRLAAPDGAARLDREATVLRGLSYPRVPKVLALEAVEGVGTALVTTRPPGRSLESALHDGLRTDAARARRFLEKALEILVYLHRLSPPVYHRNVEPRALFVEADGGVHLVDFARATDVALDADADRVVARAGHLPPVEATPAQADLYSLAATAVHLLSRTPVERLPSRDGRPDFRDAVRVDDALARFLERLLFPERRDAFETAEEALAALRAEHQAASTKSGGAKVLPLAFAAVLTLVVGGGAFAFLASRPAPVPGQIEKAPLPPTPAPPSPPPREPAPVVAEPTPAKDEAPIERDEPPKARPDKPRPRPAPEPTEHEVFLRALKRAVEAKESALLACATDDDERVRFSLTVDTRGTVSSLKAIGGRSPQATRCTEQVLSALAAPKTRTKPVTADVWIWFRPSFRVTAH